jgi:hypothetical protein
MRNSFKFWSETIYGKDNLVHAEVDGTLILKRMLGKEIECMEMILLVQD